MAEPQKGDRVKVEYEGVVVRGALGDGFDIPCLQVKTDYGRIYCPRVDHATVIEPEYETHQLYRNKDGSLYIRTSDGKWRGLRTGAIVEHRAQSLPMTRMKVVPAE